MSRRPRLSASKRTRDAIAVAAVLGLLGAIAVYRSQLAPPAQSAGPPSADTPGTGETRSSAPHALTAGAAARTTVAPPAAYRTNASLITQTPRPGPGGSRSDDPGAAIELLVAPQRRGLFRITGVPSGRLAPGLSASLDLALTNPNAFAITVRSVTVRLRTISAPRADPGHPCTRRDFTVVQFSGSGLRLAPASKRRLGRLGVARARWPRVSMLDRAVNQDGCKGASLTLDYRGVGRR